MHDRDLLTLHPNRKSPKSLH